MTLLVELDIYLANLEPVAVWWQLWRHLLDGRIAPTSRLKISGGDLLPIDTWPLILGLHLNARGRRVNLIDILIITILKVKFI